MSFSLPAKPFDDSRECREERPGRRSAFTHQGKPESVFSWRGRAGANGACARGALAAGQGPPPTMQKEERTKFLPTVLLVFIFLYPTCITV